MVRATTAARMTRLVTQWRASGEPQARFARRHGVRPWTLWYWSRKQAGAAPSRRPHPTFVPVQVVTEPTPQAGRAIEVVLVSGERLVIPDGVSSERLRAVLTALRAAC